MPSGTAEKEDKAKLDAAFAIAALSNGSWERVELQGQRASPNSRQAAAHNKRGGRRKSLARTNSSNGTHILAPVMPAREKNLAKRKRSSQEPFRDVLENEVPESQAAAGDYMQGGKFVRSAKQTVCNSLSGSGGSLYGSSETSFNVQSPLCLPKSPITDRVNDAGDETQSETKQTNGFLMMNLALSDSGIQLVPLMPSGSVSQSGDAGQRITPTQLISDPHLLQLLSNFFALSVPSSPNPSSVAAEELDSSLSDSLLAAATSSPCPAQLPGSLSTLRNYYNMTSASDPLADGQPAAKIESVSKIHLTSQVALDSQSMNDELVNMRLASLDVSGVGTHDLLHTAGGQCPNLSAVDSSASTFNSSATETTVGSSSNLVSMPGSLSILRSYYSSLNQKRNEKQNVSVRPSAGHNISLVGNTDSQLSWKMSDSALNLSRHRQGDQNEIPGLAGINVTDVVLWSEQQSTTDLAVNLKKTLMINTNNGQYPSSSYVLGSTSSSNPLRILPKISDSCAWNTSSSVSSHLSDELKRPDSVASSLSSVHLPPKKRRKVVSSDPMETPLDAYSVVLGEEKVVPLNVFMSQLDSTAHQIVINQIQTAINSQQTLASTPAEVPGQAPITASRPSLALSSSGGSTCIPGSDSNINATVNRSETKPCTAFSISSSVPSPDIFLLDVGITDEKKNAQVPARNGKGDGDHKESHSNGSGSFQLLQSSALSRLPISSLSGQFLHPVLQPDEDGDLPLHVAVAQGELCVVERVVQMMRQLNATIDCRNFLRQTPLHVAVVTGECKIVTCLLEAGASPNIADRNGQNCFHLAVQYKQVKCLDILFNCTESCPDLLNYEGMTPLHLAVRLNLPDAVSVLLQHGVQVDAVDGKSGHTGLYMAADTNRFKIAEILLSFGANAQIASYSGCSPVQAASSKSFHEMVKLLMKYGGTSESAITERSSD